MSTTATTAADPTVLGYQEIPIEDLRVDLVYQRDFDHTHALKILNGFDEVLLGVFEVNLRDESEGGGYWLYDGQHRLSALRSLGWDRAPCLVHMMPKREEGLRFVQLQKGRKDLNRVETHNSLVVSGGQGSIAVEAVRAVAVDVVVRQFGFHIARDTRIAGGLPPAVVYNVFERYGVSHLAETLSLLRDTWGYVEKDARRGPMIGGIAKLLYAFDEEALPRKRFVERLRGTAPIEIVRQYGALVHLGIRAGTIDTLAAKAILAAYNKRLQNPLKADRLDKRMGGSK